MRSLARAPAFTSAVVLVLAAGMAANAALFAVVDALLLRPLPYANPERLVVLVETQPGTGSRAPVSAPNFISWKDASRTLADIAAYRAWGFVLAAPGGAERIAGARATANLLPLLGVSPIVGRAFLPSEDRFGGPRVAIVSHAFWRQRMGAPADLTGRTIVLGGAAHAVVGVLPPDFRMPAADVLVPLALEPFALNQRGNRAYTVVARLADGASLQQAGRELDTLAADLAARFAAANAGWGIRAIPLRRDVSARARPQVLALWSAALVVLLVACANTAGLMLARAASRRQQLAICRALGAGRARIARALLAESLALAMAAAAIALPAAHLLLAGLVAVAPADLARVADARIDARVMAFAALVAASSGILFGLPAALRGSRDDLSPLLRAGRWGGRGDAALRRAALAGQVALAFIVVFGSGLLVRSLQRVLAVDPGFEPAGVLTMAIAPDATYEDPTRRVAFFDDLFERIRALPGVEAIGSIAHPPLGSAPLTADVSAPGRSGPIVAHYTATGGEWFAAMRVPLRAGRLFDRRDAMGRPPVVIVSETLARLLWPDGGALGRRIVVGGSIGADPAPREVVGVAGDVRAALEAEAPPQVYVPYAQNPWPTMSVAVRTSGPPADRTAEIRAAVRALDRDQALYNVATLDQQVGRAVSTRRFQAIVIAVFALFAALLSGVGVHAVIAQAVRQRQLEFGVRVALGATPRRVLFLAAREALRPAAAGMLVGIMAALPAARLARGLLYGVAPGDAASAAASVIGLGAVVIGASLPAAWRASRTDASTALRDR